MDVTRMISSDNKKFVNDKRFITAEESEFHKRAIKHNDCDLTFEPVIPNSDSSMVEDGQNFVFIAFKQYLVYGHFSGHCQLKAEDGTSFRVNIEHAYGHVEYVYSRW